MIAKVVDNCVQPLGLHARVEDDDAVITTQEVQLHEAKDGTVIMLGSQGYGEDGVEYTITGLGKEYVWGRAGGSTIDKRLKPEWLTSKKPDSWGQLERELTHAMFTCCPYDNNSAKCTEYTLCKDCRTDFATDIIRRAKALAGDE